MTQWYKVLPIFFPALLLGCETQTTESSQASPQEDLLSVIQEESVPETQEQAQASESLGADELVAAIGFAGAETLDVLIEQNSSTYAPQCNVFPKTTPANNPKITADQFCSKVSNRLASVSMNSCKSAKLEYSGCHSIEGIPLMVREFPPCLLYTSPSPRDA